MEEKTVKPVTNTEVQAPVSFEEVKSDISPTTSESEKPIESRDVGYDPVIDDYYRTNPFFYDIANYFGVESRDFDVAVDKLSTIVDYVRDEYQIKAPEDILLKIRELENSIMRPQWDEKRYTNLYRYIRLASQRQSLDKAMSAYRRAGGQHG